MPSSHPAHSRRANATVTAVALLLPTLVTFLYFVVFAKWPSGVQQAAYAIGKGIQFALPVVWVFYMQRHRLRWTKPTGAGMALGIGFGLAVLAAMMVLYHLWLKPIGYLAASSPVAEAIQQKVREQGLDSAGKFIGLGIFYSIVHSGMEEYYWRWFVFGQLRQLVNLWTAIVISSLGFMLHHILLLGTFFGYMAPATWLFSLAIAIGGAFWAWLYHRTDSLYAPWVSHMLVDAAIFTLGYDMVRGLF